MTDHSVRIEFLVSHVSIAHIYLSALWKYWCEDFAAAQSDALGFKIVATDVTARRVGGLVDRRAGFADGYAARLGVLFGPSIFSTPTPAQLERFGSVHGEWLAAAKTYITLRLEDLR